MIFPDGGRPAGPQLLAALVVGGAALAACDAGVRLVEPAAATTEPAVLALVAADSALSHRAAWARGVPSTSVFVRRDEDPTVLTFVADENGVLSLPAPPAADYWVWAEKYPTGMELEGPVLAPPALGAGGRLGLRSGTQDTIRLRGQENGGLVISEFHYVWPPPSAVPPDGEYRYDWYIELYNNSDTTIYLDGKIVGAGFDYYLDAELWPCAETEPFRNDPRGVWSRLFQAFPGTGHEYALAPGKAVLIAEQAIDHSAIYPGLPDLRTADFQFYWSTRAMNPAVPTMRPIQLGAGMQQTMFSSDGVPFVADALDVATLERMASRYQGDFALFEQDVLLDVAQLYDEYHLTRGVAALCRSLVHPSLDALAAFVVPSWPKRGDGTHFLSAQRKVLPDRHLQRTGTSAVDWETRARSPGKVP